MSHLGVASGAHLPARSATATNQDDGAYDNSKRTDMFHYLDEPVPEQRTLALTDVVRFVNFAVAFRVAKKASSVVAVGSFRYTRGGGAAVRKLRRVWVVDLYRGEILNIPDTGATVTPSQRFKIQSLVLVERHVTDTCRLRLIFSGVGHDHEIDFMSAFARERFVELVQCARNNVVVYSATLSGPLVRASVLIDLQAAPGQEIDIGATQPIVLGVPQPGTSIRIECSQRLFQGAKVWIGSHNLAGAAESCDSDVIDSWLPRDGADVYAVALHNTALTAGLAQLQKHLGSAYICIATVDSEAAVLALYARRELLGAVSNTESSRVIIDSAGHGALAIGCHVLETSILFIDFFLDEDCDDERREADLELSLARLQLWWGADVDVASSADHVFIFGELNFTLDADQLAVSRAVLRRNFDSLLLHDGFQTSRARPEKPLSSFVEPVVGFPPTAFTEHGPRYATRVTYFSAAPSAVKCLTYDASEQLAVSPYFPVAALFSVAFRRPAVAAFEDAEVPLPSLRFPHLTLAVSDTSSLGKLVARITCRIASEILTLEDPTYGIEGATFTSSEDDSSIAPQRRRTTMDLTTNMPVVVESECLRVTFVDEAAVDGARVLGCAIVPLTWTTTGMVPFEVPVYRCGAVVAKCTGALAWSHSHTTLFEGAL